MKNGKKIDGALFSASLVILKKMARPNNLTIVNKANSCKAMPKEYYSDCQQ